MTTSRRGILVPSYKSGLLGWPWRTPPLGQEALAAPAVVPDEEEPDDELDEELDDDEDEESDELDEPDFDESEELDSDDLSEDDPADTPEPERLSVR